jgi:hypothetical protein
MKTVWVIGGFFTKPHHLTKHVAMYKSLLGRDTHVSLVTYPLRSCVFVKNNVDRLFSHCAAQPPDIIHSISGGSLIYNMVTMDAPSLFPSNHKLVLDSGPFFPEGQSMELYLREALRLRSPLPEISARALPMMWDALGCTHREYAAQQVKTFTNPNVDRLVVKGINDASLEHDRIRLLFSEDPHTRILDMETSNHGRLINCPPYIDVIGEFISKEPIF